MELLQFERLQRLHPCLRLQRLHPEQRIGSDSSRSLHLRGATGCVSQLVASMILTSGGVTLLRDITHATRNILQHVTYVGQSGMEVHAILSWRLQNCFLENLTKWVRAYGLPKMLCLEAQLVAAA